MVWNNIRWCLFLIFPFFLAVLFSSCGKREVETAFILKKKSGETIPATACAVYVLDKASVEKILRLRQTFKDSLTTIFNEEKRTELAAKGYDGPWSVEEINKLDQLIASVSAKTKVTVEELQGDQRGIHFANSMIASAISELGRTPEYDRLVDIQSGRKALAEATDQAIELLHTVGAQTKTDMSGSAKVKIGDDDFLFVTESIDKFVVAWLLPSKKLTSSKSIFSQEDAIFCGESKNPATYFFTPVPIINSSEQLFLSDEAFAAIHGPFNSWINVKFRNE